MAYEQDGKDRWFYFSMANVSMLIIFLGFAPSFYLKNVLHAPPPLSPLTILHGVVYTAWVVLFVLQTALIGYGRPALHRQLGVLGAVLFGVVVSVGLSTAITAGRLGHVPPGAPAPLAFMALPLIAITGLALLVIVALANRTRSDIHKRLMLAGFLLMTAPALHRIAIGAGQIPAGLWVSLLGPDLLLACAAGYDLAVHKRVHPAYLWSGVVYAILNCTVLWAFSSPNWLVFATWLTH